MRPPLATLERAPRVEPWIPLGAAVLWWLIFHPGFISEDSLINLTEARSGAISVWFTAWWVYVVDALTIGTRSVSLLTLLSVLGLEYSVYFWIVSVFPKTSTRAIAVLLISLSPIVGAMGIQVRHDVSLTAGLLIVAAVLARRWNEQLTGRDYGWLLLTAPLIATRHNGVPTLIVTTLLLIALKRWRQAAAIVAVVAVALVIALVSTRASSNSSTMHPIQTVEWLLGDISCALGRGVEPTEEEWSTLTRIAPRSEWPQPAACRAMNPVLTKRTGDENAMVANYGGLWRVWGSLALHHPIEIASAHAIRVRLFLPPMPPLEVPSFLHSTIVPNDFGLAWTFPAIAERARVIVRAWNAAGFILANSMIWLLVLIAIAWREPSLRDPLAPAIVIGVALNLGLVIAAPISEGRYALFILICGQTTALHQLIARLR